MDELKQRNNSQLKRAVMRRVYFFWFIRQFKSPLVINAILFWAFASTLGSLINFTEVLTNFMVSARGFGNAMNFVASALSNTGSGALTSLIFASVTGVLLAFYFLKSISERGLSSEAYFK